MMMIYEKREKREKKRKKKDVTKTPGISAERHTHTHTLTLPEMSETKKNSHQCLLRTRRTFPVLLLVQAQTPFRRLWPFFA
jgi:hypothetical protein